MNKIVDITDNARNYLKMSVENEKALGVRVDIARGGCKGMTYSVNFIDKVDPADLFFEDGGLNVYIASKAVLFVAGMRVDYVCNLMGSNVVFENPNANSKCGCGKSFGVSGVSPSDCGTCVG